MVDGNLATEASLIVLDTLEIIVKVKQWKNNISMLTAMVCTSCCDTIPLL